MPRAQDGWPAIPRLIRGAGGPITVRFVKRARVNGEPVWGHWDGGRRQIQLEAGSLRAHKWRVLFHELCHAALHDAGLDNVFEDTALEAICDAVATARIQEMRGQLGLMDS